MTDEKTLYEILGVAATADPDVIRAAYRALSKAHHPDRGGDADTYAQINAAYETLSDPGRRAAYDQELAQLAAPSPEPDADTDWLAADWVTEAPVAKNPRWRLLGIAIPASLLTGTALITALTSHLDGGYITALVVTLVLLVPAYAGRVWPATPAGAVWVFWAATQVTLWGPLGWVLAVSAVALMVLVGMRG